MSSSTSAARSLLRNVSARTIFSPASSSRVVTRGLATVLPSVPSSSKDIAVQAGGRLRPHLSIEDNPNHGLYAFFRQQEEDGVKTYDTVEPAEQTGLIPSGRAWRAAELRRKSFKDLHTLWYVLLRERNLLATQAHECARLGILQHQTSTLVKDKRCRQSMARIKYVLNERRLAYEGAVERFADEQEAEAAEKREAKEKRALEAKKAEIAEVRVESEESKAAELAAGGLFDAYTVAETVASKTS